MTGALEMCQRLISALFGSTKELSFLSHIFLADKQSRGLAFLISVSLTRHIDAFCISEKRFESHRSFWENFRQKGGLNVQRITTLCFSCMQTGCFGRQCAVGTKELLCCKIVLKAP